MASSHASTCAPRIQHAVALFNHYETCVRKLLGYPAVLYVNVARQTNVCVSCERPIYQNMSTRSNTRLKRSMPSQDILQKSTPTNNRAQKAFEKNYPNQLHSIGTLLLYFTSDRRRQPSNRISLEKSQLSRNYQ